MLIFLHKAWVWLKTYWWFPLLVLLAIVLVLSGSDLSKVSDIIDKARKRHREEVDGINTAHTDEIKAREDAQKKLDAALIAIEKQYQDSQRVLDAKKKTEIKQIIAETHNDPDALAKRLQEVTGFKIIPPAE